MIAEAVLCVALNIRHEAGIDGRQGQLAVAMVTLNRAEQNQTSVCWEVFRDRQFTWTEDRRKRQALPKGKEWIANLKLARDAIEMHKHGEDFTRGATEYHLSTMTPWWAPYMIPVGTWGSHTFYVKATKGAKK